MIIERNRKINKKYKITEKINTNSDFQANDSVSNYSLDTTLIDPEEVAEDVLNAKENSSGSSVISRSNSITSNEEFVEYDNHGLIRKNSFNKRSSIVDIMKEDHFSTNSDLEKQDEDLSKKDTSNNKNQKQKKRNPNKRLSTSKYSSLMYRIKRHYFFHRETYFIQFK